ncbi:MAG: putative spermidine/putrescine transport system permease protein [Alphaproteobacteria bacterium]|jgi:ABC-type spermidine/putrescine transport system permease subunit I|nr:putative spermidine/putrescine transport system permease protein [Alphaproteobacteria bacterium]
MPDKAAGRRRRAAFFLALPSLVVFIGIGFVPLALVVIWSLWSFDPDTYWIKPVWSLASYAALLKSGREVVLLQTAGLAALTATASTLLAVPAATFIALLSGPRRAALLLALFTIPFFTSGLVRAFAWRLVLGREGVINNVLMGLGIVEEPVEWLLFSDFAVVLGMVAAHMPLAIVPILLAFARIEHSVIRASQDLGAGFWTMFSSIVLPLIMPGIVAGFLFVFVVSIGTSMEIQLLGGAGASSISIMINDVMRVVNFSLAFAIATVVVVLLIALIIVADRTLKLSRLFEDRGT